MQAKLVYRKGNKSVVLEEMELRELDQYTTSTFETVDDIIRNYRYKDKIFNIGLDGQVNVFYDGLEIPVNCADYYAITGKSPFNEQQTLPVLTMDSKLIPSTKALLQYVRRSIEIPDEIEWFHGMLRPLITRGEHLIYCSGMLNETYDKCFVGIDRVLDDIYHSNENYFLGRVFAETANTMKKSNKFVKDSSASIQFVKKN